MHLTVLSQGYRRSDRNQMEMSSDYFAVSLPNMAAQPRRQNLPASRKLTLERAKEKPPELFEYDG